ncbi:MAG TPA: hypothetical protein PK954_06365, partial [Anaerolineales bacterium]|nr:hypothetical protein [Anaerolineales bacterium]
MKQFSTKLVDSKYKAQWTSLVLSTLLASACVGPTQPPITGAIQVTSTGTQIIGTDAVLSASPTAPQPLPEPSALPAPTAEEATRRAVYAELATEVARGGQRTLEPYETLWARETSIYVEQTQFVESLFTPTPFGPLPFPGTRLTDEELAERGWSRMTDDGQRNEDYHPTAIWLDKAYVDAEIFSQYQALFELLAFRDGPPGED